MAFIRERSWKKHNYARYTIGSLFLQIYLWSKKKSQDISLLKWFGQFWMFFLQVFQLCESAMRNLWSTTSTKATLCFKPDQTSGKNMVSIHKACRDSVSFKLEYMFNCQIHDVSQTRPGKILHIFCGMKLKFWCVFYSCTLSYRFPPLKTFEMLLLRAWQDIIK